ncbi:hypothetical protein [Mycolicibacterium sp. GESEQ-9]|uniref:hypothetical protein n=1 Tax=Mycolicibacterium sp. GESEQ-9 TaxID=2812656 RepID=UPI001B33FC69|nr:hypothetical protein [Mycolicibacterium sp. GESEQ-9]
MSNNAWRMRDVDLETFMSLDKGTRILVLRMLDDPTDADFTELRNHPNAQSLASWLLELPPYLRAAENDDVEVPR